MMYMYQEVLPNAFLYKWERTLLPGKLITVSTSIKKHSRHYKQSRQNVSTVKIEAYFLTGSNSEISG